MKILFNKIPLHPPFPKWDLKYSPLWQRGVRGDFKKFPLFHSIFRAKLRNGFTLIEVIVVVAILFILAGAMIPFVYRLWESTEIDTTKERMSDLKIAMVGDPRLIQNGVRTHFGYIGDNGQLPALITDLVPSYMPAGYDPNKYNKDAWGNDFIYTPVQDTPGRNVSATLISKGSDGILGTTDDITKDTDPNFEIKSSEVTPTDRVQGNINITLNFSVNPPQSPPYNATFSARVVASYTGPSGTIIDNTHCCIDFSSGDVTDSITKNYSPAINCIFGEKLPVGKVLFWSQFFLSSGCSGIPNESNQTAVFVADGLNSVFVNLPTYTITVAVP